MKRPITFIHRLLNFALTKMKPVKMVPFLQPQKLTFLAFLGIILFYQANIQAQDLQKRFVFEASGITLEQALQQAGKLSGYQLSYSYELVKTYNNINVQKSSYTISDLLSLLLAGTNLTFTIKDKNILIIKKSGTSSHFKGKITSMDKEPLPGAYVKVKGSRLATISDYNGEFSLTTDNNTTLIVSSMGYETQEIAVNGRDNVDIVLKEQSKLIDQVIVTGYTSKKKSEITGAITHLSGAELLSGVPSTPDIFSLLKGKVPGLYYNSRNEYGTSEEYIRGSTNISSTGPSSPLVVLDGIVMGNVDLNTLVNPQDIESLSILKDAASTAIYGSRAALGVIVVTTKRGKQGTTVSLSNHFGFSTYTNRMKYMNTSQWINHVNKYLSSYWQSDATLQSTYSDVNDYLNAARIYTDDEAAQSYNWDKALHKNGNFNELNLSFSSGNDKSRIYGSMGYYTERGNNLGSKNERKSLKMNADLTISPKLKASFIISANVADETALNEVLNAVYYLPFLTPKDKKDKWNTYLLYRHGSVPSDVTYAKIPNPIYESKFFDNTTKTKNETYLGTFSLKYKPFDFLSIETNNSISHNVNNSNSYYDPKSQSGRLGSYTSNFYYLSWYPDVNANGTLDLSTNSSTTYMTSNTVNYSQQFDKHLITAVAGQEFSKTRIEGNNVSYYGLLSGERNAGAASYIGDYGTFIWGNAFTPSGSTSQSALFSAFGEVTYQYNQRYTATASVRTDASPSFGKDNRYGTFYALSGAWQIDQESFMASVKDIVTSLKLRYVYGTSGRDLGGDYLNKTYYNNLRNYNGVAKSGSVVIQLANNKIKWETTYNHSLGTDFTLFNRLTGSVDLYYKRSSGLVQSYTMPATQGGYTQMKNMGEVVNKGLEVMLQYNVIKTSDFDWTLGGNISFNKNKITKIAVNSQYFRKGHSIGDVMAVKYMGVDPDDGAPLFKLGDGTVSRGITTDQAFDTANMVTIGNTTPKYYGGIQSSWRYKSFTLSTNWYFSVGQLVNNYDVYNSIDPAEAYSKGKNSLQVPSSWHIWNQKGDNANLPDIYSANITSWNFNTYNNSCFYQKGSYLRLQNIRLGYDMSKSLIEKIKLQSANLYVNIDNVYVLKKKSNWRDTESTDYPLRIVLGIDLIF